MTTELETVAVTAAVAIPDWVSASCLAVRLSVGGDLLVASGGSLITTKGVQPSWGDVPVATAGKLAPPGLRGMVAGSGGGSGGGGRGGGTRVGAGGLDRASSAGLGAHLTRMQMGQVLLVGHSSHGKAFAVLPVGISWPALGRGSLLLLAVGLRLRHEVSVSHESPVPPA